MCALDVGKYVLNEDTENKLDVNQKKPLTFILEAPFIVSINLGKDWVMCILDPPSHFLR